VRSVAARVTESLSAECDKRSGVWPRPPHGQPVVHHNWSVRYDARAAHLSRKAPEPALPAGASSIPFTRAVMLSPISCVVQLGPCTFPRCQSSYCGRDGGVAVAVAEHSPGSAGVVVA
jgi:hypothetical protein